jgi:hypothetical protein
MSNLPDKADVRHGSEGTTFSMAKGPKQRVAISVSGI